MAGKSDFFFKPQTVHIYTHWGIFNSQPTKIKLSTLCKSISHFN
ncbi:hypothetical protein L579_3183 [Pantoea sp. AS-PWVM4]|nr:hypothetical protein L579_3183 [Pantoea sp. AS-PWVM4]